MRKTTDLSVGLSVSWTSITRALVSSRCVFQVTKTGFTDDECSFYVVMGAWTVQDMAVSQRHNKNSQSESSPRFYANCCASFFDLTLTEPLLVLFNFKNLAELGLITKGKRKIFLHIKHVNVSSVKKLKGCITV